MGWWGTCVGTPEGGGGGGLSLMVGWGQDSTLWVSVDCCQSSWTHHCVWCGWLPIFFSASSQFGLMSWARPHPLYLGAGCSNWLWHHPNQLHGFAHGSGKRSHFCNLPSSLPACVRQVWLLGSTWLHQCRCGGRSCSSSFNIDTLYSIAASWTCTTYSHSAIKDCIMYQIFNHFRVYITV